MSSQYYCGGVAECGGNAVTEATFQSLKRYELWSADGTRVLRSSDRQSNHGIQAYQNFGSDVLRCFGLNLPTPRCEGFRLEFENSMARAPSSTLPSFSPHAFIFSEEADGYRLHSAKHNNNMLFFLGLHEPREWVVWGVPVPANRDWEVVALTWTGGARVKIRGHDGRFVRYVSTGFVSTRQEEEATEFVLREI